MEHLFDDWIRYWAKKHSLPFALVKAVVKVESNFDHTAISPCGAIGLMQIMPETAADLGYSRDDLLDPYLNLAAGTLYLAQQYSHFPEIQHFIERMKFALASYNGGRGYINKALALARRFEGKTIGQYGQWQQWKYASQKLRVEACKLKIGGQWKRPDWQQIVNYVQKVMHWYEIYQKEEDEYNQFATQSS